MTPIDGLNRTVSFVGVDRPRCRGAAMSEMVLVAPFLLLFLVLVLFFGRMMVHAQQTQVAARYETWRQLTGAPGPAPNFPNDPELNNWQINNLFFAENATGVGHHLSNGAFPSLRAGNMSTHELVVDYAQDVADPAAELASALMFQPEAAPDIPRFPHGRSEGFSSRHEAGFAAAERFVSPIRRSHGREGNEWQFTADWRASADLWQSHGRLAPHHLRALRDVFLADFDTRLDAIDGDSTPEYPSDDTEQTRTEALAGFIRSLYLHEPGYRGPIVYEENQ